jgi:hypothetical protein
MLLTEILQSDLRGRHPIEARNNLLDMVNRHPVVIEVVFGYRDDAGRPRPYGTYWYTGESRDAVLGAVVADSRTLDGELAQDAAMEIEGGVDTLTGVRPIELVRLYVNGTAIQRHDAWFRSLKTDLTIQD